MTSTAENRVVVPFVDLGPVTRPLKAALLADVEELVDSGVFVNGLHVDAFEHAFADSCGRRFCIGMASGLDALRLALLASGIEQGDEVIVPAMTFVATFEAVVQAGGLPVPVDVSGDDMGMDPSAAEAAVSSRTRFLLPVHLYGQMADIRALGSIADRHGLTMVEDACQAHGASRDGIGSGNRGAAAAFSFYPAKNLGAFGDAGALVTDDPDIAATSLALRQHGETDKYRSRYQGYTARLDALQALVLLHKLPHLSDWNAQRTEAAGRYTEALQDVGDLRLPVTVPGATHVWHLYTVRTADPGGLAASLAARCIGTAHHYPEPPHRSRAFEYLGLGKGAFPVAEAIACQTISLPLFPGITDTQIEAVVSGIRAFFAGG